MTQPRITSYSFSRQSPDSPSDSVSLGGSDTETEEHTSTYSLVGLLFFFSIGRLGSINLLLTAFFSFLLDWGRRRKFTSESRFDWLDFHPNIQKCRDPAASLQYCEKDGDTLCEGERPDFDTSKRESRAELWTRLLDESTNASDFMSAVRVADPYTFATRYKALDDMARAVYHRRVPYESPYEPQDFKLPDGIESWLLEEFDEEVGGGKSDVLFGNTVLNPLTRVRFFN